MTEQGPIVEDLGIFIAAGRVASAYEGMEQAKEAERLGFARAWLCERFELKEAGAMLGASAGATSRIGIAAGPIVPSARIPLVLASMGATLHTVSSGRFLLGVGRGPTKSFDGLGYSEMSYPALVDYCRIIKRLWNGEKVSYDGPAGQWSGLQLRDMPHGDPPKIIFCHVGGPRASKTVADPVFDGMMLPAMLSPYAVRNSVEWMREECRRIGRDPTTVSVYMNVASLPEIEHDLAESEVRVRMIMGILLDTTGNYARYNGWAESVVRAVVNDPLFSNLETNTIDQQFNTPTGRASLLDAARRLIPEEYYRDVAVIGTIPECVEKLQQYKDVSGAVELVLYPTKPAQNAKLLQAWREHTSKRSGER